jgi:hypothetical protein
MGWVVAAAYVAVWFGYGWRLALHMKDQEIRRKMRSYPFLFKTASEAAQDETAMWVVLGLGVAACWPLTMSARGLYRIASGKGLFVTPTEKQDAHDRELKALRRQARDLGLPMPDAEETRHV